MVLVIKVDIFSWFSIFKVDGLGLRVRLLSRVRPRPHGNGNLSGYVFLLIAAHIGHSWRGIEGFEYGFSLESDPTLTVTAI